MVNRCKWCEKITDEEYLQYHDDEWSGEPLQSDRDVFELLCLEGAQSGLSWKTILKKRLKYKEVYSNFNIVSCADMTQKDLDRILDSGSVVRHKGKIKSVVVNATASKLIVQEFGSLFKYFEHMLEGVDCSSLQISQVPVSEASTKISKDLKKRGFAFVGPTTVQAFLQASGLFRAHDSHCFKFIG